MSEKKILLVAINAKYIHSNLAVYCLKGYAKEYDENLEIAEYTINQYYEDIIQDIYKRKPDVVAFSCYIWNIVFVESVAKELKKILPNLKIWLGGPEVSYRAKQYVEDNSFVDIIQVGEGEKTFKELVKYYLNGEEKSSKDNKINDLSEIKGIVYRQQVNFDNPADSKAGKKEYIVVDNGWAELMDLTEVPFPYYDMTDFENKIIYYETSRGCPFSCSYCLSSIDKRLRFREMNTVKKELQTFIDNRVPQVKFVDRTFNCNRKHAMEIWQYVYDHDNGITNFHFEIGADLITEDMLELFSKMRPGLIQLEIGVQTTNPKTLKEINRYMSLEKIQEVVEKINSFGNIHQHLDLIVGLPYEDFESFKKSFDDVYNMKPEQLQLGFLKVLSGALMEEKVREYDIKYTDFPPYEVLSTKWISYEDVLKLKKIERVVEIYYNTRQFVNTIEYLGKKFQSPYEMFHIIGDYYENQQLDQSKHSRIQTYKIMYECFKDYFKSNIDSKNEEITNNSENSAAFQKIIRQFQEMLKLDLYLRENVKNRPDFIEQEDKEFLRGYYRKYKENGKQIHIEKFEFDVLTWIKEQKYMEKEQIILFDYGRIDPINHCCRIEVLD